MEHLAVTLEALLADYEATATRWKNFFEANPGAALVPTDIAGSKNIGELVWHIHAASFRLAQRLLGEEVTDFDSMTPVNDISSAFVLEAEAAKKIHQYLETATDASLEEPFEFRSRVAGVVIM